MIFCADDFGQSSSINAAVIDLAKQGNIQAVSVLVKLVSQTDAERLKIYGGKIQIGLHLDLFAFPRLNVEAEIESQIEKFKNLFQKFPDYIDGHKHCHIYPVWSAALIRTLLKETLPHDFYLRSVMLHPSLLKSCTTSRHLYLVWLDFWGRRFKRKLISAGIKSNRYCWGVYGQHTTTAEVYGLAAQNGSEGDLFFIHPDTKVRGPASESDYDFARDLHSSQN